MSGAELAAWYFVLMPNFLILLIFAASGWLAQFDDEPPRTTAPEPERRPLEVIPAENSRATAMVLDLDIYRAQSRRVAKRSGDS